MKKEEILTVGAPSEDERLAAFASAQNRVALLMFLSLGLNVLLSVAAGAALSSAALKENVAVRDVANAAVYIIMIGVPVALSGLICGKKTRSYFTVGRGGKNSAAFAFAALGAVFFAQLTAVLFEKLGGAAGIDLAGAADTVTEPGHIVFNAVFTVIFPCVLEELFLRGVVLGELLPYGKGFAVVASGALFALMHLDPLKMPVAFISGAVFALSVIYCQTLTVCIAVHFANNLITVLFMYMPLFLPEAAYLAVEAEICAAVFTAGTVAFIYLLRHKNDAADGGALCTDCNETYKVDLRRKPLAKISPYLYVYAAAAIIMTVSTLFSGGAK